MRFTTTPTVSCFDISMLAARYGVSLRTLRFYEAQGLLSPVRQGNARLYSRRDCVRLEIILKGKRLGFSLQEISALMECEAPSAEKDERAFTERMTARSLRDQLDLLRETRASIDSAISELETALKHPEDS